MPYDTDSEFKYILRSERRQVMEVLAKGPKGWPQTELTLKRHPKYKGLFSEFTFDLSFYANGGGQEFIDLDYETFGAAARVSIEVQYKCSDGRFENIFDGKLNFANYQRNPDPVSGKATVVNIERNDLSQTIINRGDVSVDLKSTTTLDGSAMTAKNFNNYLIDTFSQPILLQSRLQIAAQTTYDDIFSLTNGLLRNIFFQDPIPLNLQELPQTSTNFDLIEVTTTGFSGTTLIDNFHDSFANTVTAGITFPLSYTVEWRFKGTLRDKDATGQSRTCDGASILLFHGADKATASPITLLSQADISTGWTTSSTDFLVSTFDKSGSTVISMDEGDKLWLFKFWSNYIITTGPGTFDITGQWNFDIAEISIKANVVTEDSETQASAIFESFSQICESITDDTDVAFDSNFYGRKNSQPTAYSENGCGSFLAVTNGLALRGFTEKEMYTTLNKQFDACNAIHNIGLGVQEFDGKFRIIVEENAFFFDKTAVVFRAHDIRDLGMRLDLSTVYKQAKFGYSKWQPETANGLDEFNSTREYEIEGIETTNNSYNQISEYIASGYLLEETRRKDSVNFATEDTEEDNDMFFVALERSVDGGGVPDALNEPSIDEDVSATTNIFNPDLRYNFLLSPERNLLRHMSVLSPSMFRTAGTKVKFRSGTGNITAEVTYDSIDCDGDYSGANLPENSDIAWDDPNLRQNDPLWIPERYTFGYPVSYTDYKNIRNNLYKLVEFEDEGELKWGWIMEMKYSIHNKRAEFDLLRAFI